MNTQELHQRLNLWVENANNAGRDFTYPFTIEGARVGRLVEDHYYALAAMADLFQVGDGMIGFRRDCKTPEARSEVFAEAVERLVKRGQLAENQLRNEVYGAMERWGDIPQFWGERAAFPYFGLKNFGVHVHGLSADGRIWLGKRAASKHTDPGKLDQIAAGGQPLELTLEANLIKECWEEAGIPAEIAQTALARDIAPIRHINQYGYVALDLYLYDLTLPEGFVPSNQDGEVESFALYAPEQLLEMLSEDAERREVFAGDVAVCLLELLARQGLIDEQQFTHPIRVPA